MMRSGLTGTSFTGVALVLLLTACGQSVSGTSTDAATVASLPSPLPLPRSDLAKSPAAQIVTGYLDAAQAGDCATAERYTLPDLFMANGDLCIGDEPGPIRFDQWRSDSAAPPAHPSPDVYEYSVELHVTAYGSSSGLGSTGWTTWFLEARKGPDGYRLVGGGSGP